MKPEILIGRAQLGSTHPPIYEVTARCGLARGTARLGAPGLGG